MSKSIDTSFSGLVEKGAASCIPDRCIARADSTLGFCTAPGNCATTTTTKTLFLNQRFSVLQKITTTGFEKFYLIPKSLTFSGLGLNRVANIISSAKAEGSTEIVASVEFAYPDPVKISVQSALSTVSGRRMLIGQNRFLEAAGSDISGALATSSADAKIEGSSSIMMAVISMILFIMF